MEEAILGFDLDALLASKLSGENRPPDGLLHPSGDLRGSLRHSQLRAAGAPTVEPDIVSSVRLMTGTLWHSWFEELFRGKPVMTEVTLDKYLPAGWSGRADWVIWSDEMQGFVLGDLKTTKGEGIKWIERDGIKEEHQWQASCYWWALFNAGFPMVDEYFIYYLPQNQVIEKGSFANVRPLTIAGKPLAEEVLLPVMQERWEKTQYYLEQIWANEEHFPEAVNYLQSGLEPVQARILKQIPDRKLGLTNNTLVPHWSANYCPYPEELCNCRTQGTTKIGHWIGGTYIVRKGFEGYNPTTGVDEGAAGSWDAPERLY